MNSQWILNILFFVQIHLKKSIFIFVTRLGRNDRPPGFLSHVPSRFNIFFLASSFASIYQPQGAHQLFPSLQMFASYKNIL